MTVTQARENRFKCRNDYFPRSQVLTVMLVMLLSVLYMNAAELITNGSFGIPISSLTMSIPVGGIGSRLFDRQFIVRK